MRYLLGIDVGSNSSKGVLVNETGIVVAMAQRKHEMRVVGPGLAEHDAEEDWWAGFRALSKQLITEAGIDPIAIAAVGCSGIGPCVLPVDEHDQPLRQAILYGIDTRAHVEIDELNAIFGENRILRQCGNALTTQSVGPKIRWLEKNEPDIFARTRRMVGCTSYLVHRLTGHWVVDHYSASCYTPCYDLAARGWDQEKTARICPVEWLPEILWTTEIARRITAQASVLTGLATGTPVIAGTIDSAAEAVSVGVQKPGDLMVMYGTTAFFIQVNGSLTIDERYWAAPFLFPDTWSVMGGLATAGALTQWFRKEIVQLPDEEAAHTAMVKEAALSPAGANGLLVLPYFSGERTPINDPHAKGMIFGLTLSHTRGDMYRAVIEGIGHAVRHNLTTFEEAQTAKAIYAVGGGVKSALWTQAVSDIAGIEQHIRKHTIGAALGSAFLAGISVSIFAEGDIERVNPVTTSIAPHPENLQAYSRDHAVYLELYRNTKHLMRR